MSTPTDTIDLAAQEHAAIDAAFAALADDRRFLVESEALAEEAIGAGWEALRMTEAEARDAAMSTRGAST